MKNPKRPIHCGRENLVFSMLCWYDVNHLSTTGNALQCVVRVLTGQVRIFLLHLCVAVTKQFLDNGRVNAEFNGFGSECMPA